MAPEQAEGRGAAPRPTSTRSALVLYEALAGVNPVRGRGAPRPPGGSARGCRRSARLRRDLPLDLCGAIDRAVWPRPEERGTLERAARRAARALAGVGDGARDDRRRARSGPPASCRAAAPARPPAAARPLAGGRGRPRSSPPALRGSDRRRPFAAPAAGAVAARRRGRAPARWRWLAAATGLVTWLADEARAAHRRARRRGAAVPTAVLAAPGRAAVVAAGPRAALGVVGLAGAWPALAGQAARPLAPPRARGARRLVARPGRGCRGETLWPGRRAPTAGAAGVGSDAYPTSSCRSPRAGRCSSRRLWALAAVVLPVLVRGRIFAAGPRRGHDLGRRARLGDPGRGPRDARPRRRRGRRRSASRSPRARHVARRTSRSPS